MHYNITEDIIIKSENAAKSHIQSNSYLLEYIKKFSDINIALDYGCGKLRYTIPLCQLAKKVVAVDSVEQISRNQIVWDERTSIINYSNKVGNLEVYSTEAIEWKEYKYDFILCSNVLSAIPYEFDRMAILKNIKMLLSTRGKALITTQYRNSYFSTYEIRRDTMKYNDGWIIKNKSYYSFYGLINVEKLINYCSNVGLTIDNIIIHDGSAFVVAK